MTFYLRGTKLYIKPSNVCVNNYLSSKKLCWKIIFLVHLQVSFNLRWNKTHTNLEKIREKANTQQIFTCSKLKKMKVWNMFELKGL